MFSFSNAIKRDALAKASTILFYNKMVPVGFYKSVAHNDKTVRVVKGATGGIGAGTNSFSSVMAQTNVGNTTITGSTMPSHRHLGMGTVFSADAAGGAPNTAYGGTGNSTSNGSDGPHAHSLLMAVKYLDMLLGVRM